MSQHSVPVWMHSPDGRSFLIKREAAIPTMLKDGWVFNKADLTPVKETKANSKATVIGRGKASKVSTGKAKQPEEQISQAPVDDEPVTFLLLASMAADTEVTLDSEPIPMTSFDYDQPDDSGSDSSLED